MFAPASLEAQRRRDPNHCVFVPLHEPTPTQITSPTLTSAAWGQAAPPLIHGYELTDSHPVCPGLCALVVQLLRLVYQRRKSQKKIVTWNAHSDPRKPKSKRRLVRLTVCGWFGRA